MLAVENSLQIKFIFNSNWHKNVEKNMDAVMEKFSIQKVLEIGSFEGQSSCYFSRMIKSGEIHCVDTWKGDEELRGRNIDFNEVEKNFDHNIRLTSQMHPCVNFFKYKKESYKQLANFISEDKENYFDLIYIDGAHDSKNVLIDAINSYKLLKDGGVMIFDDYLWKCDNNLLNAPKLAIDSFVNIFSDKLQIISHYLYQLYLIKREK